MSQFETDRENQAVGPELCDDCNHPLRLHGPDGCEHNTDHHLADFGAVAGNCGCSATTLEPEYFEPRSCLVDGSDCGSNFCPPASADALGHDALQNLLAAAYAAYIHISTRNLVGHLYGRSPLVGQKRVSA